MDTCSGFRGTKSSWLSGVILLCLLPTSNTHPEMGRQEAVVAKATLENRAVDSMQASGQETIGSNSRNLIKLNSLVRSIPHARPRRSASLPDNKVPSDQTTTQKPSTGLPSSALVPHDEGSTTPKTADGTNAMSATSIEPTEDSKSTDQTTLDPTSNIPIDMNNTLLLNLNDSFTDEDNDTLSFNQTDLLYVNGVPRFVKSEVFIISLIVGICVILTVVSVSIFLCYRRCSHSNPATKRLNSLSHHHGHHNSCNGTNHDDAVTLSYINAQFDQKFLQDNPEEMQSLENDTFLNSLESMMFVNRWTETANSTKS